MARTYKKEYKDRVARAKAAGFESYHEQRAFRGENVDVLRMMRETYTDLFPKNVKLDTRGVVELYDILQDYFITGEEAVTGQMRHELVSFFLDEGMKESAAVKSMREILGTTP